MKAGEDIVALGIVYLIKPSVVREWSCENLQKIKTIASKIYNLYILNKSGKNWILMIYIFMVLTAILVLLCLLCMFFFNIWRETEYKKCNLIEISLKYNDEQQTIKIIKIQLREMQ